jgi:hypothetical protein
MHAPAEHLPLTGVPAALPEVRAMALWLAAHDIPVFPVIVGGKTPATRNGFKDATTNPAQIGAWWARKPYNVGVSTGPARLCVIDLDVPRDGKTLPEPWASTAGVLDGTDVLAVLAERAGQPAPVNTRTVVTPSGGVHLYFTAPCPLPSTAGRLGPMVDTRAMGGYVVAPPSRTTLAAYTTAHPGPIAPLPDWLTQALTPRHTAPAGTAGAGMARRVAAPRGPVADRYVYAAFDSELDNVLAALPGTRNATLNRTAYALGRFVADGRLNQSQVVEALTIAAGHVGLDPVETARTIASALTAAAGVGDHAGASRARSTTAEEQAR